jgi:hypothetical protein
MTFEQIRRGIGVRVQRQRLDGHLRDRLADDRVLQRSPGILTPHERAVVGHQRTGNLHRVVAMRIERLDDDLAGVVLVVRGALSLGEIPRTPDRPVEGVRVGSAEHGDVALGLRERDRGGGVGVGDAADVAKRQVEPAVGFAVDGGSQVPLHDPPVLEVDHDELLGGQVVVGHARGLDDIDAGVAVDAADVAPRQGGEAHARNCLVSVEHLVAEPGSYRPVHAVLPDRTRSLMARSRYMALFSPRPK